MSAIQTLRECLANLQKRRDGAQQDLTQASDMIVQSQRRLDMIGNEIADVLGALTTLGAS